MYASKSCKLSIFLKSIKIVSNWYLIPLLYYKLLKKKYLFLFLRNGYKLKLRRNSTDLQAFANVWLIEEYNKKEFKIMENDIVIDIGAHIGLFTLYASQFCKKGKILCFEPVEENYDLLLENIQINNLVNVTTFNKAISNEKKITRIYLSEDQAAHSFYNEGPNFIEVESISLKEVIDSNKISECNLLKLDCEGAEYDILRAFPDEYFKTIMKICMEYHFSNTQPHLIKELKDRLGALHYNIVDIPLFDGLGLLFVIKINDKMLGRSNQS